MFQTSETVPAVPKLAASCNISLLTLPGCKASIDCSLVLSITLSIPFLTCLPAIIGKDQLSKVLTAFCPIKPPLGTDLAIPAALAIAVAPFNGADNIEGANPAK